MVTLTVPDGNPIHVEGLERQRDAVQALLSEALAPPSTWGSRPAAPVPGVPRGPAG